MKALTRSLVALAAALALPSCAPLKTAASSFDYSLGSQNSGYFLTITPKPAPPMTHAKESIDVRPP